MLIAKVSSTFVTTYDTQEWEQDEMDFGRCPGHSLLAMRSTAIQTLGVTDFCNEICPLLYARFAKKYTCYNTV